MNKRFITLLVAIAAACALPLTAGAAYTFVTLAGAAEQQGTSDGTGSDARFSKPIGSAVDAAGNIYISDSSGHTIRKITPSGVVTTFAGSPGQNGYADGTGSAARFSYPWGIAIDAAGNLYVCDSGNNAIRKITPSGVVSTLAGNPTALPTSAGSADGTGADARFSSPSAAVVDASGNLFVTDYGNSTIRKVTSTGVVTTFAGMAGEFYAIDGTGTAARFNYPDGIGIDSAGNLYVADRNNHTIRKVTPTAVVTTHAGKPLESGSADGWKADARFNNPTGIVVDSAGTIYVSDTRNETIRRISAWGIVSTIGGSANVSGSADGEGADARFFRPVGISLDGDDVLVIADTFNNTVRIGLREIALLGDFDNDKRDDVLWRNNTSGVVAARLDSGDLKFFGTEGGSGWTAVATADFDGDNRADVLWRMSTGLLASWTSSTGYQTFGSEAADRVVLAASDVDGDGTVEVLWRDPEAGWIYAWTSSSGYQTLGREVGTWRVIGAADFDGDHLAELYWRNTYDGTIASWTSSSDYQTLGTESATWVVFSAGDVDGDGSAEILWRNLSNGQIAAWASGGTYQTLGTQSASWTAIAASDFDADGTAEVLWRNESDKQIASWTSTAGYQIFGAEAGSLTAVGYADVDSDGISDILWRHSSTGRIASWTSLRGYQTFGSESSGWTIFSGSDMDGDGSVELVWKNADGLIASWTSSSGYQSFGAQSSTWIPISTADFDGDGFGEVLWRNASSGLIAVWTSSAGYQSFGNESSGWTAIGARDVDGDGSAEVVWRNTTDGTISSWTAAGGFRSFGAETDGWTATAK